MNTYRGYTGERLLEIYRQLYNVQGAQNWWPAQSPLEVVIGAVLTQSVSWKSVEKAIANLAAKGFIPRQYGEGASLLPPQEVAGQALLDISEEELGELIRPAGFFRHFRSQSPDAVFRRRRYAAQPP